MGTIPIMNGQTSLCEKVLRFEGKKARMALMVVISVVFGAPACTQCPLALQYPCCFLHEETGLAKLGAQPESHGGKWGWDPTFSPLDFEVFFHRKAVFCTRLSFTM